jgi:hypothetical protein
MPNKNLLIILLLVLLISHHCREELKKFVHAYDNIPSLSIIYCCQDGVNSILYSVGPNLIDENGLGDDYVQGTKMLDYME